VLVQRGSHVRKLGFRVERDEHVSCGRVDGHLFGRARGLRFAPPRWLISWLYRFGRNPEDSVSEATENGLEGMVKLTNQS
jgi:hypothetical protein